MTKIRSILTGIGLMLILFACTIADSENVWYGCAALLGGAALTYFSVDKED